LLSNDAGATETDLLTRANPAPGAKAYFASLSPHKRIGTTADLGDAVALIVSESARWISGQSIVVSGGAK
jgi:NAD(P)-dependent dehydrogenase (short-subunit alcohol dehydrogenase family)